MIYMRSLADMFLHASCANISFRAYVRTDASELEFILELEGTQSSSEIAAIYSTFDDASHQLFTQRGGGVDECQNECKRIGASTCLGIAFWLDMNDETQCVGLDNLGSTIFSPFYSLCFRSQM